MNTTVKITIWILVIVIVIEITYLIYRLLILKKELDKLGIELESVSENLEEVKRKLEAIKETKDSWQFFLSIYLILSIFAMAKKDYKKNKKSNKKADNTYIASLARVCAKNMSTISKIKFI